MSQDLTREDLAQACAVLGCSEAELKAVIEVEAAGSGFDASGRPKILFEPHIFERELKKRGFGESIIERARAARIASPKWDKSLYGRTPDDRWLQVEAACQIDLEAGLASASYGMGQVLGQNYAACGFNSPSEMVQAMAQDEGQQVLAMARFILTNKLDGELRSHDWMGFARGYNGPQYHLNEYDVKLARAFKKHRADPEAFWANKPNHGYAAGEVHSLDDDTDPSPTA